MHALGQAIPATLLLINGLKGISGRVESEMGNGELISVTFDGESFEGTISFDIAGHTMEAQIGGEFTDDQMEGNITLQDTPPLSFTGSRIETSNGAQQMKG